MSFSIMKLFSAFFKNNFIYPCGALTPSGKPRHQFIDLAKGLCMILVVAMHASRIFPFELPDILRNIRMPLYFMLSGLFFSDYGSFKRFTEKKINKILVPLVFFSIVGVMLWDIPQHLLIGVPENVVENFISHFPTNYPLWFLIALFADNILYAVLRRLLKSDWLILVVALPCTVLTYLCAINEVRLPLLLAPIANGLVYFTAGRMLAETSLIKSQVASKRSVIAGISLLLAGAAVFLVAGSPYLDFYVNNWVGHPATVIPVSILLTSGLLLVCKFLRWLPVVSYLGRYSIVTLGLHLPVMYVVRTANTFVTDSTQMHPWLFFLFSLILCWMLIPLFITFFPHFTAQTDGLLRFPQRLQLKKSILKIGGLVNKK